jgi:hypothetical protein
MAGNTTCCVDFCDRLAELFYTVEDTFSGQLVVLFGLLIASLICGIYLSITFFITTTRYLFITCVVHFSVLYHLGRVFLHVKLIQFGQM